MFSNQPVLAGKITALVQQVGVKSYTLQMCTGVSECTAFVGRAMYCCRKRIGQSIILIALLIALPIALPRIWIPRSHSEEVLTAKSEFLQT